MAKKLGVSPSVSSLTNEHLGIIVQNLAKRRPSQAEPKKTNEVVLHRNINIPRPANDAVQDSMFNLDISGGDIAGRAVFLAKDKGVEIERYWVFRTARNDDEIERNNFQLVRKLSNALETHIFVEECYQAFLERPADSEGLANYVRMLKSKHLSPRDFMIALLTSPEGRGHTETLIVVPYPSAHLNKPSGLHS